MALVTVRRRHPNTVRDDHRMDETSWHVTQTDRLCVILQERSIAVSRDVVSEFVTNMVTVVAETAGVSTDTARSMITAEAAERWADSLAPTVLTSDGDTGESVPAVLLSAHTLAESAATLVEVMRAARAVEQVADTAALGLSSYAGDSGALRDLAMTVQQQVQSLSKDVARHVVTQPPLEMLQLPVVTYTRLVDFLDEVAQSPLLLVAEDNGHGTYHHTVAGEYTLSDVVSATLHDLDLAAF
ncbi:hypothetical protein [Prescottella subtropica]|uniref:hypothetical protein n=1 Tax=Prescottella subtropica TaxID=2545757 RepID=UPI0019D61BBB|nr:hypothetical protein [Prescottella subtropica]